MKTEQENCTVTVRGIQRVEGDEDVVELVTGGRFTCHGGCLLYTSPSPRDS